MAKNQKRPHNVKNVHQKEKDGKRREENPTRKHQNKPSKTTNNQPTSKTETSNDLLIFVIFLIGIATFFLVRKLYFPPSPNSFYGANNKKEFMAEGKLTFLDAQSEEAIIRIDIEIAKSNYEIEQGLMFRRSLPANAGMLFIFDKADYRTFWMKNTFLSLDILFLNEDKEIIRISKNTTPLSEISIPSGGKAQYVVEVLAGFTDAYQIHLGDHIEF